MPSERQGIGCLGSILGLVVLTAVVVAVIFAGLIALGVVAALVIIGLVVIAIDRLLLALSPKRRERRATMQRSWLIRGPVPPSGPIIDTTAHYPADPGSEPRPENPSE